jgi:S-DNA-T family DNA segregation ATPase FtsK/SpoIIIE
MKAWKTPEMSYSRLYADLLNRVHVLIAGATGSGKSTVVQGMMHAALRFSPARVGFILIDPKACELSEFSGLPHTIDYASTPADIPHALRGAVQLMQCRLADMKRRHLREYDGSDVYVIIDELLPIMTRPEIKKECYSPLLDLLALARAAHIHVIACTQTPVASVIPTPVKCNFDTRLALRTACGQDSRNIIGLAGCETFPNPRIDGCAFGWLRDGADTTLYKLPRESESERRRVIHHWLTAKAPRPSIKSIFGSVAKAVH